MSAVAIELISLFFISMSGNADAPGQTILALLENPSFISQIHTSSQILGGWTVVEEEMEPCQAYLSPIGKVEKPTFCAKPPSSVVKSAPAKNGKGTVSFEKPLGGMPLLD